MGLCGIDCEMLTAKKKSKKLGLVGEIADVNAQIITDMTRNNYIPVIATVASGEDGVYNINADTAAAKIAAALGAERFLSLTDVPGLLMDPGDDTTLISEVHVSNIPKLVKEGVIKGGMIPKIDCCVEAIRQGVKKTSIIDGRVPHSILMEMFSHEGMGTQIY